MGMIGLSVLLFFMLLAVFAPYIASYELAMKQGMPQDILTPPSSKHPLGTDDVGRDIYSQIVFGSRVSLLVGFLATVVATSIGTVVGLLSGYYGGSFDEVMMRFTDIILVIPWLPLMIVLAAIFGPSLWNIVFLIGGLWWTNTARIVRSQVLTVKERTYIEKARALGASDFRIMFHHILPNVMALVFANAIILVAWAIMYEAVLSFLGLGVAGQMSWGLILHYAFMTGAITAKAWWYILPPGICIITVVSAFASLNYSLDEIINPRAKVI
jgi:peptide/nickel transport system permease protein